MDEKRLFPHKHAHCLHDEQRLKLLSEETLVSLLALEGHEDVADLGSGTGFYTNRLARHTTGTVYAVDVQEEMLAHHRRAGLPPNVVQIRGDIDKLPCSPGTLDRAVSISTFHEAHEAAGLAALARALRPGGRVVVVDWRRDTPEPEEGPPLAIRFTKEEVGDMLSALFEVRELRDLSPLLFAVTAEQGAASATTR
jgi:SAM-dependent methyltransferase